jgi:hypothetical protein
MHGVRQVGAKFHQRLSEGLKARCVEPYRLKRARLLRDYLSI